MRWLGALAGSRPPCCRWTRWRRLPSRCCRRRHRQPARKPRWRRGSRSCQASRLTDRPRPEVNPTGLQTGDFFWFPSGEVDEAYNDNIFATRSATSSDLITVLQPRVDLLSSLPQGDALNLHAGAALQYYARHSAQDTTDGFGAVDGRLAVTAGSYFYGGAQIAQSHTPRTSPDSPGNAAEPGDL